MSDITDGALLEWDILSLAKTVTIVADNSHYEKTGKIAKKDHNPRKCKRPSTKKEITAPSSPQVPETNFSEEVEDFSTKIVSEKLIGFLINQRIISEEKALEISPLLEDFIKSELPEIDAIGKLRKTIKTEFSNEYSLPVEKFNDRADKSTTSPQWFDLYYKNGAILGKVSARDIQNHDSVFARNFARNSLKTLGQTIDELYSVRKPCGVILGASKGSSFVDRLMGHRPKDTQQQSHRSS